MIRLQKIIKNSLNSTRRLLSRHPYLRFIPIILTALIAFSLFSSYRPPKPPKVIDAPTNSLYLYETGNENFKANIGSKNTTAPFVQISTGDSSIAFSLNESKSTSAQKVDNVVVYENVRENTNVTYASLQNGIKEEIILSSPTKDNEYIFTLNTKNAQPREIAGNNYSRYFFDGKNRYQFHLEEPFAIDANGNRTDDVGMFIRKSENNENQYQLRLVVPKDWLESKDRVYPVIIDPTIVHNTGAEFALGTLNRAFADTSQNNGAPTIELTQDANTVGLYHFNETANDSCAGSADACDSSGNGNHGVATGTTISTTASPLNNSRTFATTNTVALNNESNFDFERTSAFSIEAWVKTSNTGVQTIVSKLDSNAPYSGYELWINNDGTVRAYLVNSFCSNCVNVRTTTAVNDGQWHHIAMTYSGSSTAAGLNIYIDGVVQSKIVDGDNLTGSIQNNIPVQIGSRNGVVYYFIGTIDEVQITNDVRSAGEIAADAARGPAITTYYQELPTDEHTVALWHLDEASGNALDSSGNGFTGTATGTTIVSGLLNNGRSLNGSSDYIYGSTSMNIPTQDFTYEAWINPDTTNDEMLFMASDGSGANELYIYISGNKLLVTTNNALRLTSTNTISTAQWQHIAVTRNGANITAYVNGIADPTTGTDPSPLNFGACGLLIGTDADATCNTSLGNWFDGTIDEIRVSNTARSAEEIKSSASRRPYSTYTSPVLDLGQVESWTSFVWDELGVNTGDGETIKNSNNLIAQWNFNETSGTTADNAAGSCGASCDGTLSGFDSTVSQDADPDSGWTANNRRWGVGALQFDGIDSFISVPHHTTLNPITAVTLETWYNPSSIPTGTADNIIDKRNAADGTVNYLMQFLTSGLLRFYATGPTLDMSSNSLLPIGQWNHIVMTYDGSTANIYINGKLDKSGSYTGNLSTATDNSLKLCRHGSTTTTGHCHGILDSTRIYSRALSASEVLSNYNVGNVELQTRVGADTSPDDGSWEEWRPVTTETQINSFDSDSANWSWDSTATYMPQAKSDESNIKVEGAGSLKQIVGQPQIDANTVALWRLDETNGDNAGDDIFDTSSSGLNGEINGTNLATGVVNGIIGKGRNFNGTDDYVEFGDTTILDGATQATISVWVKPDTLPGATEYNSILSKHDGTAGGNAYFLRMNGNEKFRFSVRSSGGQLNCDTPNLPLTGQWTQIVSVLDTSGNCYVYFDGMIQVSATLTAFTSIQNTTTNLRLGSSDLGTELYFDGVIDEVKITNTASTAEEIAESYRMGRDHYLNKTISSTDLSAKKSLPFYITADRPGSYLSATIGESAYANYQPDANTVGLWHLEEADAKYKYDLSGTTIDVGEWVEIDPGANKISQNNGIVLSTGTVSAWDSALVSQQYFPRTQGQTLYTKITPTSGSMMVGWANNSTTTASYTNITHALYLNGGNIRVYQDGTLVGTYLSGYSASTAYEFKIALTTTNTASYYIKGGAYTSWTLILQADSTKSNTPLRVQIATYNFSGTFSDITVYNSVEAQDSSGNNNNGFIAGVTSNQGKIGQGKTFDGSSDKIIIPNSTSLNPGSGDFTIEAWVNSQAVDSTFRRIYEDYGSNTSNLAMIWLNSSNKFSGYYRDGAANATITSGTTTPEVGKWYHIVSVRNGTTSLLYINGVLEHSATNGSLGTITTSDGPEPLIGGYFGNSQPWLGIIDEVRISNIARSADEIRQAYEVGLRTHPITIDFGAALDSGNLITGGGDLSFTVDATVYGLTQKGSQLFPGDKIIVRENYNGTEYIAQGTVTGVTASTGAVTVVSWDTGSTFPSGGYTTNADVFKWQREYFDVNNITLDSHLNAITLLSVRLTDGNEGRTIWLDDLRSAGDYLTTPASSTITSSTDLRYFQYRAILTSSDESVSPSLSSVSLDYEENIPPGSTLLISPTNGATGLASSPTFTMTASDANGDYIRYKITLCTNSILTENCQTFDQTVSQTGWSGQNTEGGTAYTSGTQGVYTAQTPLQINTSYYWRAAAIDPGGTNTFGNNSVINLFTTGGIPGLPTLDSPASGTTGATTTPTLRTTATDSDGDELMYRITICTNANMTLDCQVFTQSDSQVGWSGQNALTGTAYTSGTQASYTIQTQLTTGVTYWWKSEAIDPLGSNSYGPIQGTASSFTVIAAPEPPAPCTVSKDPDNTQITLSWTDVSTVESGYQLWRSINGNTPEQVLPSLDPDTESYIDTNVSADTSYAYLVRSFQIEGSNTIYSGFCATSTIRLFTGNFLFEGLKLEGLQID